MPTTAQRQPGRHLCAIAGACVLLAAAFPLAAQEADTPDASAPATVAPGDPIDFGRDVRPILARRCFHCHGPDVAEAGLRLNERETALAELDSGERAIVPGKPDLGVLLQRVAAEDESLRMPPEGKPLTADEIDALRRWIAQGAEWEQHWAFQPPQPQTPPSVKNKRWVKTPIDAFVLARLESEGLTPAEPASRLELVRRAYYDLTGLPPSPEEVLAFVRDESPDAWENLIDRLLESPRYGEHWARHWLDLVRYAETNSFERDGAKPNAWRYRDYVIRAFNDDKPYDRFIREQLAGDELPDANVESLIATGYYRLGLWDDEPADMLQARFDELDDIVSTTGQVFLGLTINCARCHDHKIDPIPQADYYRMLAFFHEVPSYGIRSDQRSFNQTDISPPEVAAAHAERDRRLHELRRQMEPLEQKGIAKMPAEDQRKSETRGRDKLLQRELVNYLDEADWQTYSRLKAQYDELHGQKLPPRESALSVTKCIVPPPETHILMRGNPHVPGERVEPGFPVLFGTPDPEFPPLPKDAKTSGRRTVLADWIASPENPLTARVMVNRVWQFHFGRGLFRSSNNVGLLGEPPTHPELLDWLAAEFTRGDWRLKPLHKLIMMSNAYRMSTVVDAENYARDPQNDLLWRFDMRRLSAEEIRDSIHAANGRLNVKMFGPSIYPDISKEVLAGQSQPGSGWGKSSLDEQARRSVYIHVKRSLITPILADFDFPETDTSCAARFATTQSTQALGMLNGDFLNREAAYFAERLRKEAGEDRRKQVERAIWLALSRPAMDEEIERGVKLIDTLETKHNVDSKTALDHFCLLMLNLNEFIYLD